MNNDLYKELSQNFIEYAVAVNTDRAIPDAKSGLKPVAKRIIYGAFDQGHKSSKPHVKCADIVGNVMGTWHPHGDSSIYGALVRLAQDWVMRYPLIDFHGSKGNQDGDGPAAYRYTEARLAKLTEDGMLCGIKKQCVDFIPNYSETRDEPVTLPSIFPNLLCNPNTGIGVAMACNWLPHNLTEVAKAIHDYTEGKEPMIPGPDFPTGGIIINRDDLPTIVKNGRGSVKLRGKYSVEGTNIVFTEIPYGVATEALMEEIAKVSDEGIINGIKNIRNESNRKQFRLVIECEKTANVATIVNLLFKETSLQTSISYNQVALVDKTPTELGLKDCIKIYLDHNIECIKKETQFDLDKLAAELEIFEGLLKALEDIDNIITLIKGSESSAKAKTALMSKYGFSEAQAKAIVDMKLGRLAGLERIEIIDQKNACEADIKSLNWVLENTQEELLNRLDTIVKIYGDARRTELAQIEIPKEEKETVYVEPEKCVVIMSESGLIKRIPTTAFKAQKRASKGVKTQNDITSAIIRTNTVDSLMVFSNQGNMYRLIVDAIPAGTNASTGVPIKSLIEMKDDEEPTIIYSIYKDTDAKYVMFVTKNGMVKKTLLEEYINTKRKTGIQAIKLKEEDSLASVFLIKEENIYIATRKGFVIKFDSKNISATSRVTCGVKGIALKDDVVVAAGAIRDAKDELALFTESGLGKRTPLTEFTIQNRGGKGLVGYKLSDDSDGIAAAALINDEDMILILGNISSVCLSAKDVPSLGRATSGNIMIKNNKVLSVSKV